MKRYTVEQIRTWMRAHGAPDWLYLWLSEHQLDVANPDEDEEGDDPKPDGIAEIASELKPEDVPLYRRWHG